MSRFREVPTLFSRLSKIRRAEDMAKHVSKKKKRQRKLVLQEESSTEEFDDEEDKFPNHMLIRMKQFKILNKKSNSILQSQVDLGSSLSVSIMEVDDLLKTFEAKVASKFSRMVRDSEMLRGEVKEFKNLVKDVKKVREDVNLKIQELRQDMQKDNTIVKES
ncbi:unnamed protein product [Lactuca saligna]|uniref:Uncharacterized protein n=1 Tax=Lactuca saligna TaxID=75948 RepID=A0AA36E9K9_LACSI|nr:unnamed protein product [Lactuca saligna]